MALFTKKDPCAICGGKVKGLFPWKIDGQLVCIDCHGAVDLPAGVESNMSMEDFRAYMAFREENTLLKQQFQTTQQIDFGLWDTKFMFDMTNRLLCMDKHLGKTIFEGRHIKSFVIKEDTIPLYEGSAAGLIHYVSTVPDRAMAMAPQITQMAMQAQMRRDMERMRERMNQDNDNNNTYYTTTINIPEPFKNFNVELRFEHPYWDIFTADMSGPTFDNERPDLNDYLRVYDDRVKVMDELAHAFMNLAFPDAPEQVVAPAGTVIQNTVPTIATVAATATDVVEEIQRFKALMEQGIITEEEFAAKKRQLLGI